MAFAPSNFFDLSQFGHVSLFDSTQPVWSALSQIKSYLEAASLGEILGAVSPEAYLIHPELISIGEGSIVEPGAYIAGPCIIGKNCQIRHGAYIRGNVILGDNCVVGHATELKNTIFLNGAQAGHFAYVGDSILGNTVNLGAGTKCANLRFDRQNVTIRTEQQVVETGRRKFGVIMGDGAQTGCNAVTNPGTLMEKKSWIAPNQTAKGMIETAIAAV